MKKTETATRGLLELLAFKTGCMYLSDLHRADCLYRIQNAVSAISPEEYSLWEWNDAVYYITGKESFFRSQKRAASFLKSYENI